VQYVLHYHHTLIEYITAKKFDKTCVVGQFYATHKKNCNTFVKII
jgi:hypothetical protein